MERLSGHEGAGLDAAGRSLRDRRRLRRHRRAARAAAARHRDPLSRRPADAAGDAAARPTCPASASIASSAATAASSAASRCPPHVDVERIAADLSDGVLTVTVPKAAGAGPRRIDVELTCHAPPVPHPAARQRRLRDGPRPDRPDVDRPSARRPPRPTTPTPAARRAGRTAGGDRRRPHAAPPVPTSPTSPRAPSTPSPTSRRCSRSAGRTRRSADDPFFEQFFGDMDVFGDRGAAASCSLGSGVVVSPDGYILTNVHVLGAAGTRHRSARGAGRQARAARASDRRRSRPPTSRS